MDGETLHTIDALNGTDCAVKVHRNENPLAPALIAEAGDLRLTFDATGLRMERISDGVSLFAVVSTPTGA